MVWKFLLGFVILVALIAGGLAIYGSFVAPPQHTVEQVVPDSRFAR
jgi:hypothetical protein